MRALCRRALAGAVLVAGLGTGAGLAQDGSSFEITSVSVAAGGETVELTFRSETGQNYRVEGSPVLGAGEGSWSDTGVSAAGDGGEVTVGVATAGLGSRYFFRIAAEVTTAPPGFVLIPAGTFQMGDSFGEGGSDERPVHPVNVSAFFLQAKETTKAEWDEVHVWAVANGYRFDDGGRGKAADHPVHTVTWYNVVKWCNARSEKEGLEPCYYTEKGHAVVYRTGDVVLTNAMVKWEAAGYRLPTEAEWEKAARGGLEGRRFPWGDTISHSQANFSNVNGESYATGTTGYHPDWDDGGFPYTSPVGSFAPNGYGLYDMIGNVWEWCWDWHDSGYYMDSPVADPLGADLGSLRETRGGAWDFSAGLVRVANRFRSRPGDGFSDLGFRPARGQ